MLAGKLFPVPNRRYPRDGVEIFHAVNPTDHLVMVASDKNSSQGAGAFSHFIGAGTIPDDVAEVYGRISWRSRSQTSFECFEIAMDIAEEK